MFKTCVHNKCNVNSKDKTLEAKMLLVTYSLMDIHTRGQLYSGTINVLDFGTNNITHTRHVKSALTLSLLRIEPWSLHRHFLKRYVYILKTCNICAFVKFLMQRNSDSFHTNGLQIYFVFCHFTTISTLCHKIKEFCKYQQGRWALIYCLGARYIPRVVLRIYFRRPFGHSFRIIHF